MQTRRQPNETPPATIPATESSDRSCLRAVGTARAPLRPSASVAAKHSLDGEGTTYGSPSSECLAAKAGNRRPLPLHSIPNR